MFLLKEEERVSLCYFICQGLNILTYEMMALERIVAKGLSNSRILWFESRNKYLTTKYIIWLSSWLNILQ